MYLAAVVPTIDEAETIGDLARALDKMCDAVVVSDASDGPETCLEAQRAGAWIYRTHQPGLGHAYQRAWEMGARPDWHVVHIDAGGSHNAADVYPMIELAEKGFDVVIGSRFCPGGHHHGPWKRRITSRLASGALNFISLCDYSDWTSGFRLYSPRARAVLAAHEFTTTGHAWQIESLWTLIHAGMRIVEHPITYRSSRSQLSAARIQEAAALYWRLAGQ
jgi:dolichol-phosphate mannosyltransferase